MKSKMPIQILTVIFALGLLAAYVVYSQGKQTPQTVLPSSKLRMIDGAAQMSALEAQAGPITTTNQPVTSVPQDMTVLSSSKVLVPVMSNPPAASQPATSSNPSRTVIGGSKSAAVFTPGPKPSSNLSKAVIYGSKSAPAFVPTETSAVAPAKSNAPAPRTNTSPSGTRKP